MSAVLSTSPSARPVCILISALGGEGGGVLKDWVVATAHAAGYPVQATSIPGVAQRTGATTYYVEVFPVPHAQLGGKKPVLCLSPTSGQVDFFVGSELMEAARQMQNGMVTKRTIFIASTHRVYTTAEKMAMGDGRFDSVKAIDAAHALAKQAILFNMEAETAKAGTVISAVMFGALIAAMNDAVALVLPRATAEQVIKSGGKGTAGSLRGFAAGFANADGAAEGKMADTGSQSGSQASSKDLLPVAVQTETPTAKPIEASAEAQTLIGLGRARCADYLDSAYANLYLERLAKIRARDNGGSLLTQETARFLALWMCYEDVARVADLKSRLSRFDGIRAEAVAQDDQPIKVVEFFKPGYGEVADQLPPALAAPIRAFAKKRGKVSIFENGIHVESTSFSGYVKLRALSQMRRFRRASSRYLLEQAQIERWLAAIAKAPSSDLALEIALTARLIKGYSDTHQRGKENFLRILETLVEGGHYSTETRTAYVRAAREAALADPEGKKLDGSLEQAGIAPRPIKVQTIQFFPRATEKRA